MCGREREREEERERGDLPVQEAGAKGDYMFLVDAGASQLGI